MMDSSACQRDSLSGLPDVILIIIISSLSFKECVSTSALSRRWKHLYRETRSLSFKESDHVSPSISNEYSRRLARESFIQFMRTWISNIHDQVVESFEICLSHPVGYEDEINALIKFAVSKKVKNLALDFSDTACRSYHEITYHDLLFELPESVYSLTTLETLKIYRCEFEPSRFTNLGLLRSLSIAWIRLENIGSLLSKYPLIESLSIKNCWGLNITTLAGRFREVTIINCDFTYMNCAFELPNVDIFKYSGIVFAFYFDIMNTIIKEVHLDFTSEREYDEPCESTQVAGEEISGFLNGLRAARTLTVCPFLLQAIQECRNPNYLLHPMEIRHLVLRTNMRPKEFNGIRHLLDNCPKIETLILEILPPDFFPTALTYAGIDSRTYWMPNITYKCLVETLKVVIVKQFRGTSNELNVLRYLIRSGGESGPEHGAVLERVELYVHNGLEENRRMVARAKAEMLQRSSKRVQVLVHSA